MPPDIRHAYRNALVAAAAARERSDLSAAFAALERAHILAQRHLWPHLVTHLQMLRIGWQRRDAREIAGQLLRIVATLPGWLTGWVPKGNTGGANVPALRPMPLPRELEVLLAGFDVRRDMLRRVPAYAGLAITVWLLRLACG